MSLVPPADSLLRRGLIASGAGAVTGGVVGVTMLLMSSREMFWVWVLYALPGGAYVGMGAGLVLWLITRCVFPARGGFQPWRAWTAVGSAALAAALIGWFVFSGMGLGRQLGAAAALGLLGLVWGCWERTPVLPGAVKKLHRKCDALTVR